MGVARVAWILEIPLLESAAYFAPHLLTLQYYNIHNTIKGYIEVLSLLPSLGISKFLYG